ncbi:zona pellucida sperm-binding protein 3-like isoform X1 [Sinocyclocheilus grahami]|uniref:Zona pellucida sperm-binding protein 3 n=1 Tax=Sinocyclocheilus grahami TaxID=75366 RepID=A0A672KQD6_SINGR|nr:PREDICTED: zona pellucida sperm-binding protein 3-like isoform X1 [Sinocyclocheilus grahami]
MERIRLYFCCSLYFLGILHIAKVYTCGTVGHLEYSSVVHDMQPVPGAARPCRAAGDSEFMKNPPVMRPYRVFPMFQHVPVPLVDMELLRPVSGRRPLPDRLSSLLIPQMSPQRIQVSPVDNGHGVEVWCGYSKISVRINKNLMGLRSSPSSFHLGTCPVSRSDENFMYFHYDLDDCDSSLTMMKGQIIYSNMVHYTPTEPPGTVIRAVPLTLNIQCLYNRYHYSYKMGFLPVARERVLHKIFESRAMFSLFVCNEHWERLEGNGSFVLGKPMYFEASAAYISKDERIFVDSCYATASRDPKSTPQHKVIWNYGCIEDSRRQGSLSRFLQRMSNFIRFSVEAFLLPQVTGTYVFLHCTISVHRATTSATAKSCTYNHVKRRWEELYTDASACACCDSACEIKSASSLPHVRQSITSKPWSLDKNEQSLIKSMEGWVKVQEDTERMKFKSVEGIDEKEDGGDTVEIVTNTEEQMEAKEKNKKVPMNDLDEDVEVIAWTVETTATELKDKNDGSGKVMFVEKQKNGDVKIGDDAGRHKSTNRTDNVGQPSVQVIEELLRAVNDQAPNKSGAQEIIHFTSEELSEDKIQPEDFEKNMHVQSTISTQLLMDEEIFLNAKHEPMEWHQDEH